MSWRIESTPLRGHASLNGVRDRGVRLANGLEPAFLAFGQARTNLDKLLSGNALCVTTGQQPGLLSGPVMTIHKALATAALAERCSKVLNRHVVPVFWVAGDDHDFAESNHFHLISNTNEVERIELRSRPDDASAVPLYREKLGQDIVNVFDRVRALSPDTEFRDAQVERFTKHYVSERDVATAFAGAMAELLGEFGIVVFQPYVPEAKTAFVPILESALTKATAINEALIRRSHALQQAGHAVPVSVKEEHTLVMYEGSRGRDRVLLNGHGFNLRRSGETFSAADLLKVANTDYEKFSANVLLRPVTEAAVLPTVAYVAGPTEVLYWEQADAVFDAMGIARHPVLTRWSGHIVENRVEKTLEKYGLVLDDLSLPEGQLESRLVRENIPEELERALTAIRRTIDEQAPRVIEAAATIDPTLRKPTEHAQHNMLSQLEHIERKVVSQLKRRNEVLMRQVAAARAAIYPLQKPQERVINVLHYLIRHGPDYLNGVMRACQHWAAHLESPVSAE